MVTAILMNYKRQPNVRVIIPALRRQTAIERIVLVNNGQPYVTETKAQKPDDLWIMPHNIGPFARFLAAYAYDDWIYFQDDDVMPADDKFVADMLTMAQARPDAITGVYGRNIHATPPHYLHADTNGATNMVKAICMLMHRKTLARVRFPAGDVGRCDDIWVSLETSRGAPLHYSDISLARRLKLLPQWGTGLSHEAQHYPEREEFCAQWMGARQ